MELTYDNMVSFMQRYFKTYSKYGQSPKTIDRMKEFWAPEFEFVNYFDYLGTGTPTRWGWDQIKEIHRFEPAAQETLTCDHLVVDERRKEVAALIRTVARDKITGEVKIDAMLNSIYELALDADDTIKITRIWVFEEYNPSTIKADEVFHPERKAGKTKLV
jgi:hypothetical protein